MRNILQKKVLLIYQTFTFQLSFTNNVMQIVRIQDKRKRKRLSTQFLLQALMIGLVLERYKRMRSSV